MQTIVLDPDTSDTCCSPCANAVSSSHLRPTVNCGGRQFRPDGHCAGEFVFLDAPRGKIYVFLISGGSGDMMKNVTTMAVIVAVALGATLAAQKTTPLKTGSGGSPH